jgi:outer membrane protein OmpA-like peptidoglycan-associated protein
MSAISVRPIAGFAGVILAAGLALFTALAPARAAEERSTEQIIKALKPDSRVTRSLTTPAEAARATEDARFVDGLRNRTSRSLTADERDKIVAIAKKKPSIDLEINFEYNSANIAASAMSQVAALGQALSSADLKGNTFIVAGHTDAKGGEVYNQGLSERRAEAVKRFLAEKHGIDASSLVTVGYGKLQLKNTANPFASENRRVQLVNMADK